MKRSFCSLVLFLLVACDRLPRPIPGGGSGGGGGGGGAGECLLEYNSALVEGDPCCFSSGGANTCDPKIRCNDLSGSGCCLIYGTSATAGGGRCCLYEDGTLGDDPAECKALLSAR